jgi:hypothetical protein
MAVITPDMEEATEREAIQAVSWVCASWSIADPNRLDFKWNLGDMKAFAVNSTEKEKKSQVFLSLLNQKI